MTKLKVGDRVRLRGTQDRGLVRRVGEHDFDIAFDGSRSQTGSYLHDQAERFKRLRPKKKPEVIEFECTWISNYAGAVVAATHEMNQFVGNRTRVRVTILGEA
jgi:hypothetical protein